jgi:hypothetical protein
MADAMLPLFDNMPPVTVLVEDSAWFHREPYPAAVYDNPNIVINPVYARTCSFDEVQGIICHELIHAWLQWKGLVGAGQHLDQHHSELFVKKALEINRKKIDNLNVDVDRLLATPKAVEIYSRVAGIRFAPYLRHKGRKIRKYLAPLGQVFLVDWRFSKVVVLSFSVVVITLLLNKARLIPERVTSVVWIAWFIAVVAWYALVMIRQRTR